MSTITKCRDCGGNIVKPSFHGDGDYPVEPMCRCADRHSAFIEANRQRDEQDRLERARRRG